MNDYSAQLNEERNYYQTAKQKAKKIIRQKIIGEEKQITGAEFLIIGVIALLADFVGPLGFLVIPILWFWYLIKFKKFPTKKFLTAGGLEIISLGFLPGWTGLIIISYLEQKGYLGNNVLTSLGKK